MRLAAKHTESELLGEALDKLTERAKDLEAWLLRDHEAEIKRARHLDKDTRERVYWHYGYASAIRDALRLIVGDDQPTKPC
jgi:Arc/MetJ-type ribon-helix-helix transcriptional regulator